MKTMWAKNIRALKNHTLAFHGSFEIPPDPDVFLVIAVSNLYRIFIDGEFIGYGPARAAHGYTRKDRYQLTQYMGHRINIVVEVFAANVNSYYIVEELPFFGAEIHDKEKVLASAGNFQAYLLSDRIAKIQRYSFQRPFAECYRMKKCRKYFYQGDTSQFEPVMTEEVSSNIMIERHIAYPKFEKIRFCKTIESGALLINPMKEKWVDRSIFEINEKMRGYRYDELEEYLSDEASSFEYQRSEYADRQDIQSALSYTVHDFGRTITGFPGLKAEIKKQSTIYLIWDEIISDRDSCGDKEKNICFSRNSCCNVIKFSLEPGLYDLLAFEPTSARFIKVILTEGEITLTELSMTTYENSEAYQLMFVSDDIELNAIVSAATNTFSQNSVDILTDCPSRERAGWLFDSYFSGRAEKTFTGRNRVERNFLENYYLALQLKELPKGMIPMCYPADHYDGVYIPNWSMWYVLELLSYFRNTNDIDLINASREKVYGLFDFFMKYLNEDGLLEDLESWVFIEWSRCNDPDYIKGVNYPTNMLYSEMLNAASLLYGDPVLKVQSDRIKAKIIKQSYNGEFFEDNAIREEGRLRCVGHITETCQYYAFYFNISSIDTFPELFSKIMEEFGPSRDEKMVYPEIAKSNAIVGNYLRLELLLRNGDSQKVLEECRLFFLNMAMTTGTLWEHSYELGSLNHGFASITANYIIEAITGYLGVDNSTKEIRMGNSFLTMDCAVRIPIPGDSILISIQDGAREVTIPDGYTAVSVCARDNPSRAISAINKC
ncbi:MAG: alpha-L-rhamnosidase-related protein [Saccharofermentanales bacterium]